MHPLSSSEIRGNWATLLLPLNADDSIDYGLLAAELDHFIAARVSGVYSNGTGVQIDRNHWTQQPAAPTVDYAGTGITGASAVCTPVSLVCP